MFLLLKYKKKLLTFLVKNPTKKLSCFLGAFIWNHPIVTSLDSIQTGIMRPYNTVKVNGPYTHHVYRWTGLANQR